MKRPGFWYGFVVPWIGFALLWAEFSPGWDMDRFYWHRLMLGLAAGFIASGLSYLLNRRLLGLLLRRLARRQEVLPAAQRGVEADGVPKQFG